MWTAKGGSTAVKGVIACSPPTYFDERPRPNFDKYIPKVQPNGRSIEFLPISVAQDIKTPLFLMHGKRDDVVSFDESERLSKILKENGVKLETLFEEHAGHHDCWKNPARYIERWTQWIHAL